MARRMQIRARIRRPHSTKGTRRRAAGSVMLAAAILVGGAGFPARALDVGPKNIPLTVAGVPVDIPVIGSLDAHTDASRLALKATATGDLKSIQDNAPAIRKGIRVL